MSCPRILVVDDDPKFLHLVSEILIGAAYDVRATEDPFAVVKLAEEFRPNLIILDPSIPGKGGSELAEELRSNKKTAKIPCMFLTAKRAVDGMEEAKETGAIGYLEKPVRSSSLLWMIRVLLQGGTEWNNFRREHMSITPAAGEANRASPTPPESP